MPDPNLYQFDGYLQLPMRQTQIKSSYPLTINNVLLRGTLLRNTSYVYGLVAFTGEETKIRLNSTMSHTKSPRIQRAINRAVIAMFVFLVALSAMFSALSITWNKRNLSGAWYLYQSHQDETGTVFQFIILFNTLIPISLYVTMEIVKLLQALYISWDRDMYHTETDTPAQAQTCTINEDLGQISFVFSDKTGTLTDNVMEFRKCSVGGFSYTHDPAEILSSLEQPQPQPTRKRNGHEREESKTDLENNRLSRIIRHDGELSTLSLARRVHGLKPRQSLNTHTLRDRFFMIALAVCHTAVPEMNDDNSITYQAASPDEAALVSAARELGFTVVERTLRSITLKITGEDDPIIVEILNIIEFTSDRKRMSVVIKLPTDEIVLICKGADSVILERMDIPAETLARSDDAWAIESVPQSPISPHQNGGLDGLRDTRWEFTRTMEHLQDFATDGLRTLLYAYRILSYTQYNEWNELYEEACLAVSERQKKIAKTAEIIECKLRLIGASAIEDKLQEGVPEAIECLRSAGMKIWMLTGDKRETAINIGYSCRLIHSNSNLIVLGDQKDLRSYMEQAILDLQNNLASHAAFVVDGATLEILSQEENLLELFCHLGCLSSTVICCRVSPSQKALVVKSIRRSAPRAVTLAIGDGANDIAMIQEAHVGIGITGKEGMQASRASDYCFAQFRFLCKLLLVHGHWSYVRVSRFVLGTFAKVVTFYLTQGVYQFWTGFSGTSLYESWTLSMYNTLFSSLPVISVGIFEQDLNAKTLLANPHLYIQGQLNQAFNLRIFITWVITSVYSAIVVVVVPIALISEMHYKTDGGFLLEGAPQIYTLGCIIYTIIVIVVTLVISYVENHNQTWISHLFAWIELIGFFIYQIIYGYAYPARNSRQYDVHGDFIRIAGKPTFWLLVILVTTVAILPSVALKVMKNTVLPNVTAAFQQAEKDPEVSSQWDEIASKWAYDEPDNDNEASQVVESQP
jgi:phospholipid-translocating ATPase